MYLIKYLTITAVVGLLVTSQASAEDFSVKKTGHVLIFEGSITKDAFESVRNHLDRHTAVLLIDSIGGDGEAGLAIAKEIRKRNLLVVVNKYCLSSCANYIFVGARRKSLSPGAILGFHGGLTGGPVPDLKMENYPLLSREQLKKAQDETRMLYDADDKFFRGIGFNSSLLKKSSDLTKLANIERYIEINADGTKSVFGFDRIDDAKSFMKKLGSQNKSYSIQIGTHQSRTRFYFPSIESLEKYGVKGIERYCYPNTPERFQALEKKFDASGFSGIVLVGDVPRQ